MRQRQLLEFRASLTLTGLPTATTMERSPPPLIPVGRAKPVAGDVATGGSNLQRQWGGFLRAAFPAVSMQTQRTEAIKYIEEGRRILPLTQEAMSFLMYEYHIACPYYRMSNGSLAVVLSIPPCLEMVFDVSNRMDAVLP